jgi:hypothetical protein
MHLREILWVFFRVLLVGFGLFGPGAARAPYKYYIITIYIYRGTIIYYKEQKSV